MHISPQFLVVFDDQFTTVTADLSTCSPAFYESLYKTTSWLHKDVFGDAPDLHHFESYWSALPLTTDKFRSMTQPPMATSSSSNSNQTSLQNPVVYPIGADPEGDPARNLAGDPARHPEGDPAKNLASDPARNLADDPVRHPEGDPARNLADDPARPPTSDPAAFPNVNLATHPTVGRQATYLEGAPTAYPAGAYAGCFSSNPSAYLADNSVFSSASVSTTYAHRDRKRPKTGDSHNQLSSRKCFKPTERVQLTFIPCCPVFATYKDQHGINAKVYTATITPEQYPSSSTASDVDLDQSSTVFSPLLA
jgi:hypothetical protein